VPRLSILIPCLGDCREFEDTLASVLQNRPENSEILVAHAEPYADPYRLKGEVCFLHVPEARSLARLLNAGFEAARSGVVHVLQCGLEVTEGWTDQPLELLEQSGVATVAPMIVERSGQRLISAGLRYSRHGRRIEIGRGQGVASIGAGQELVGPTLAAGFYRRWWWRIIRWDETLGDQAADLQFSLTLRELGAVATGSPECIIRSQEEGARPSVAPLGYRAARDAERVYWTHRLEPVGLSTIALRVVLLICEALLALPSPQAITGLAGRIAGWLSRPTLEAKSRWLADLRERMAVAQASAETSETLRFPAVRSSPRGPSRRRAA
jgi:hypothetical protein